MDQAAVEEQIDPRSGSIRQLNQPGVKSESKIMQSSVKDPRGPRLTQESTADATHGNGGTATASPHPPAQQNSADGAYDPAITPHGQQSYDHKQYQTSAPDSSTDHPGLANMPAHSSFPHIQANPEHRPKTENTPPSGNIMPSPNAGSKIFVGGLSWETDETSLKRYFETYGEVLDCVIMRDRHTGHPRGFGFVTFADDAVAGRAASRRHDLDGRQVEAKRAVPRNEFHGGQGNMGGSGSLGGGGYGSSRGGGGGHGGRYGGDMGSGYGAVGSGGGGGGGGGSNMRSHHTTKCKVFVGGLPSSCGVDDFRSYFQTFGDVIDAQVMIDHNTGNSRGFGFVTFATEDTVEQVVGPGKSNTRHEIMGKNVEVKRAEPKGASNDRRNRDSYNSSGGGRTGNSSNNIGANTAEAGSNSATAAAAAYYSNYPGASLAEQYGAYYNNPQWQQYYAAMGYNFNAYPQGYNPYSYLQAYMSNVANGTSPGTDNAATPASGAAPDAAGYDGASSGGMRAMGRYGSDGGGGGLQSGNGGLNSGGGSAGGGSGARRSSRRDERYHPYR